MPLVRIALREGKNKEYRQAIGIAVHRALVETFNVPEQDRFQLINEYSAENLIYAPEYLGIAHSDEIIIIQLTVSQGRTLAQKQQLYERITQLLAENPGVRPEDVFINLVEVAKENWSFGNGIAQYVTG
jgi:phenylpyruvate tautomerase PptA (4-oxalocrotonate tautomerase family)